MVLLQFFRNQLNLNVLFLTAADADIRNIRDFFNFRNNYIIYVVIKVCLRFMIYSKHHCRHIINVHLRNHRRFTVIRKLCLYHVHFLFQIIISLVNVFAVIILNYNKGNIFHRLRLNGINTA